MVMSAIAQRVMSDHGPRNTDRSGIAASILFNLLLAGGDRHDEALRDLRRGAGLGAPVAAGIDMNNWATRFAQLATTEQREWLLETAVRLVSSRGVPLPMGRAVARAVKRALGLEVSPVPV